MVLSVNLGMAQFGSALDLGSRGRRFKSCYPDVNSYRLKVGDKFVTIYPEDVIITRKPKEGWAVASKDDVTVALDTRLTPDLIEEGKQREQESILRREIGRDFAIIET